MLSPACAASQNQQLIYVVRNQLNNFGGTVACLRLGIRDIFLRHFKMLVKLKCVIQVSNSFKKYLSVEDASVMLLSLQLVLCVLAVPL